MRASDAPSAAHLDFGYSSSLEMARVLVQYMDDPETIRLRIREDFDRAPAHVTIARMRREYLASRDRKPEREVFKAHDGHYPLEVEDKLARANRRFLDALKRERELSAWLSA